MPTKNGIEYLASPHLEPRGVVHGFLSRRGGVSGPPFDSLNFDGRDTDAPENIAENMSLLARTFSIPAERLVTVNQVHGNSVLFVDSRDQGQHGPVEADAIVTGLPGVPIGIMTADCLPVLFYDPAHNAIGAAHAGWKGTAAKVSVKTIEAMRERFGSDAKNMIAALGPYIGPCCYSIKENVEAEFKSTFGGDINYIQRIAGELRLDIGLANVRQIISAGVPKGNISMQAACTSCNNNLFFSYRKDGKRTGRQLSFIMLK